MLRNTRPTAAIVPDIGLYFPFVNREEQLKLLNQHLEATLQWYFNEDRGIDIAKRFYFTLCHGISGLGKTTLGLEGIRAALAATPVNSASQNYSLSFLLTCCHIKDLSPDDRWLTENIQCRISFTDIPRITGYEKQAETCIALRILYSFLQSIGSVDKGYRLWLQMYE